MLFCNITCFLMKVTRFFYAFLSLQSVSIISSNFISCSLHFSEYFLVNYTFLQFFNCFTYLCHILCHAHSAHTAWVEQKQQQQSLLKTQYHFQQVVVVVERNSEKNTQKTERIWRPIEESVATSVEAFHSYFFSLYATFLPPCLVLQKGRQRGRTSFALVCFVCCAAFCLRPKY